MSKYRIIKPYTQTYFVERKECSDSRFMTWRILSRHDYELNTDRVAFDTQEEAMSFINGLKDGSILPISRIVYTEE